MSDLYTDQLSDYLDDALDAETRTAVETHLASCDECAKTLAELRQVRAQLAALGGRAPQRDLWPDIRANLDERGTGAPGSTAGIRDPRVAGRIPRRISFTVAQLAAACVALLLLGGGGVWLSLGSVRTDPRAVATAARRAPDSIGARASVPADSPGGAPHTTVVSAPGRYSRPVPVVSASFANAEYDAAVADLERVLAEGRGRLRPATVQVIEHNLRTIDDAIAQARTALAADPASTYLNRHLADNMQRKLELLRHVATIVAAQS